MRQEPIGVGSLPLTGVRVIDLTHFLAGPFATRLLSDLGADVVRIETRLRPVRLGRRRTNVASGKRPLLYQHLNRNKRSIELNLKDPSDLQTARRLISAAHVVVDNFRAGVMNRLGLGYDDARGLNPSLVYISMSGFGQEGPRSGWKAMNVNMQAQSGLAHSTGQMASGRPTGISNSWCDYIAGLHASFLIVEGIRRARETQQSTFFDFSQMESNISATGTALVADLGVPQSTVSERQTPAAGWIPGNRAFRCKGIDEWCMVALRTSEDVETFTAVVGRRPSEIGSDGDIAVEWFLLRDAEDAARDLIASGIAAAPMNRIDEVLARQESAYEPGPGTARFARLPTDFSDRSLPNLSKAPDLGEHSTEVLEEWLGQGDG